MRTTQGSTVHAINTTCDAGDRGGAVNRPRWPRQAGLLAVLCLSAASAQAVNVLRASPQGEVRQLRQFSITFDQAAVPLEMARRRPLLSK